MVFTDIHKFDQIDQHSVSSVYENDQLLYSEIYNSVPRVMVSVCYNQLLDEYVLKIYRPTDGSVYRQPFSTKLVKREIGVSDALLQAGGRKILGRRIISRFLDRVLNVLN